MSGIHAVIHNINVDGLIVRGIREGVRLIIHDYREKDQDKDESQRHSINDFVTCERRE
jgi:hypothetical protein